MNYSQQSSLMAEPETTADPENTAIKIDEAKAIQEAAECRASREAALLIDAEEKLKADKEAAEAIVQKKLEKAAQEAAEVAMAKQEAELKAAAEAAEALKKLAAEKTTQEADSKTKEKQPEQDEMEVKELDTAKKVSLEPGAKLSKKDLEQLMIVSTDKITKLLEGASVEFNIAIQLLTAMAVKLCSNPQAKVEKLVDKIFKDLANADDKFNIFVMQSKEKIKKNLSSYYIKILNQMRTQRE